ncbi:MAG: DUF1338 domain-containing protein [Pseudomonadota bacterium]
MQNSIDSLFSGLWNDYLSITPSAEKIHALLSHQRSSEPTDIVNDHIALRTFNLEKVKLSRLAEHFLALGYVAKGDYTFEAKKLDAKHFEHSDPIQPKVFISELKVELMPDNVQEIIHRMIEQMPEDVICTPDFLYSGSHWDVSNDEYEQLLAHSEYAAWMSAWGYRANHFTVSVNHLASINSLEEVNNILKNAGFSLNTSGGEIKGGADVFLAQSSTMADKATVRFSDKERTIPSCFYEFAQRFVLPNGKLYQGFVAASADKIFESTNVK